MTRLSNEELNAIRERCEKATPGPWESALIHNEWCVIVDGYIVAEMYQDVAPKDAEFIAAARADVPMLLAHIEKREADIIKLANDWSTVVDEKNALQAEVERLRRELSFIAHVDLVTNAYDKEHIAVSVQSWAINVLDGRNHDD